MKDSIERISGNAFTVSLMPESPEEKRADAVAMSQYYHNAIQKYLGNHIKPVSITPHDRNPFCATVELMTESGSI